MSRKKTRRKKKWRDLFPQVGAIFSLLLMFFSSVGWGLTMWRRYKNILNFEETKGRVIAKRLVTLYFPHTTSSPGGRGYVPEVRYEYTVNGQEYEGYIYAYNIKGTGFSPRYGKKRWAQEILKRYHIGDTVRVYYDPRDPGKSLLTKEIAWIEFYLYLGLVPLIVLIIFYLNFSKDRIATKIKDSLARFSKKIQNL